MAGKKGVSNLLGALKDNLKCCEHLKELKLAGLKFDTDCCRTLGLFLGTWSTKRQTDCNACRLGKANAITTLDISNTGIDFRYLCSTLESNNTVEELFANQIKLTVRRVHSTLRKLILR